MTHIGLVFSDLTGTLLKGPVGAGAGPIDAGQITTGTIDPARIPPPTSIPASIITGTLDPAQLPNHPGTITPIVDGTAAVGTSANWAHEDHVHPTDTTRAPINNAALTGDTSARHLALNYTGMNWTGNNTYIIRSQGTAFGTLTQSGIAASHTFNMNGDSVDATSAGGMYNSYHGMVVGGASAKGHRTSLTGSLAFTSATGNVGNTYFYTAMSASAIASAPDGGVPGTPKGNLFAALDTVVLQPACTNWNAATGREIDVTCHAGASVAYKTGLQIVQQAGDAVNGSISNDAFSISNQGGATSGGWKYGITFGSKHGVWAIQPTGTLIGADTTALGGPAYATANGVDFSAVTFSDSAFKSTGFAVSGTGAINATGGDTTIGSSTALANAATSGFLRIPFVSGAPTGTPAAGNPPMVFDTTNSKLWVYNGTWMGVVLA